MSKRTKERAALQRNHAARRGVRRRMAVGGLMAALVAALVGAGVWLVPAPPAHAGEITVYKSRTCVCCEKWLAHARGAGFRVTEENLANVAPVKEQHGVPRHLVSCHTSVVGGYVIEGHVPPELIVQLLDEKPAVAGLAVPGMPAGSPGMEGGGAQRYDVLAFTRAGETVVYATR